MTQVSVRDLYSVDKRRRNLLDIMQADSQRQAQSSGQVVFANGLQQRSSFLGIHAAPFLPAVGGTEVTANSAEDFPITQPEGWKIHGGHGDARLCEVPGKSRMFHDGCGLASPGRWDIEKRIWNDDFFWKRLRAESYNLVLQHCGGQQNFDRICFEMAAKGEEGCSLMKNEELTSQLVELWCGLLQSEGYEADGLDAVAKGQPFKLRLMEALLDRAGDSRPQVFTSRRKRLSGGCATSITEDTSYVRRTNVLEAGR